MKLAIEFINAKNPLDTQIGKNLDLCKEEAHILSYMLRRFLNGEVDMSVIVILSEIFGKEDYIYLDKIEFISSLIDKNFVVFSGLGNFGDESALNLEILNSTITLGSTFLRFVEVGFENDDANEDYKEYTDHLEYLKDQFLRIEYYQKLAKSSKLDFGSVRIKQKIQNQENRIKLKLKATEKPIHIEEIFEENELNEKEKIIFLALLKEEYSGEFDTLRELNTLLSLVSNDDYEKIKNRALLDDDSKLIENNLVDYDEVMTGFGGISRNFFINEEVLQTIMNPNKKPKSNKLKLDMLVEDQEIFELVKPTTTLDDVVMHPKTRELMDNLLKQVDKNVIARLKKWGIKKNRRGIDAKIILYGPPGTGKTMTATSLAKSLKKQILSFDCSKILSKYVGESEQNVRKIFDSYKEICQKSKSEPVLLLNEADQFLSARTEGAGSGSDKMHNQMQNIFLEQLERFEGILIATTNFLESLDSAFSRRFDYKIEFKKPDFKQRLDLWRRVLPEEAVYEENFDIEKLANFPLSGGQIVVVLKNTALRVAVKDEPIFTFEDFAHTINREIKGAFGEEKFVGFMN